MGRKLELFGLLKLGMYIFYCFIRLEGSGPSVLALIGVWIVRMF